MNALDGGFVPPRAVSIVEKPYLKAEKVVLLSGHNRNRRTGDLPATDRPLAGVSGEISMVNLRMRKDKTTFFDQCNVSCRYARERHWQEIRIDARPKERRETKKRAGYGLKSTEGSLL